MSDKARDSLYADARTEVAGFTFNEDVARVFDDMIDRSVPGYSFVVEMTPLLVQRFAAAGSRVYDLGCSTGACTRLALETLPARAQVVAVDQAQPMLDQLQNWLAQHPRRDDVQVRCADIRHQPLRDASLVFLNYTLQFLALQEREALLQRIFDALQPGGALVLSEKISVAGPEGALLTELHHGFKRAHGYSELEIANKRTALENVLVPEALAVHEKRLHMVGFQTVVPWFQCFPFVSVLAGKP